MKKKITKILTLFYATFQCGLYNVKKNDFFFFFAHEKLKKPHKKVAQNRPRPLFPTNQPRPQPTAQNWFSISWNFGTRHLFSYLCFLYKWKSSTRKVFNVFYEPKSKFTSSHKRGRCRDLRVKPDEIWMMLYGYIHILRHVVNIEINTVWTPKHFVNCVAYLF